MDNAFACDDVNEDLCATFYPANHYPNIPSLFTFYYVVLLFLSISTAFVRNMSAVVSKTSRATIDYLPAKGQVMGKKGAHNVKKQTEKITFQLSCFPLLGFYTSPLHLLLSK